jgi:hypothetical protein
MFDSAKVLAAAGIRAMHPDISQDELRRRVFDRLYAGDFAPEAWRTFRSAV